MYQAYATYKNDPEQKVIARTEKTYWPVRLQEHCDELRKAIEKNYSPGEFRLVTDYRIWRKDDRLRKYRRLVYGHYQNGIIIYVEWIY